MSNTVKKEVTEDIQTKMLNTLKEKGINCNVDQVKLSNYIVEKVINYYDQKKDAEEQTYDETGRKMAKYIILYNESGKYSLFGFSYTLGGIKELAKVEGKEEKNLIVYRLASDINLLDTEDVIWKTKVEKEGFGKDISHH